VQKRKKKEEGQLLIARAKQRTKRNEQGVGRKIGSAEKFLKGNSISSEKVRRKGWQKEKEGDGEKCARTRNKELLGRNLENEGGT